ncbi:MAG TPA: NADP-dependent oxidoreductase [Acetobacteraceae bacterium]|nr:NADP-dependent oxidoreductase [Acetobacteraceae bacterium]
MLNRRITLQSRPTGIPGAAHFTQDEVAVRPLEAGELLVETMYISIDPAMRSWIADTSGYARGVAIGNVMRAGGIGRVLQTTVESFAIGDLVQGRTGWQSHPILRARDTQKLDLALGSLDDWMGPLGTSALTAYFGVRDIGALKPGETLLVSAAAGGVGQIAAQIGMIDACRVIGTAGGPDKCQFLRQTLGLHGVIDYKAENDLEAAIRRECAGGVDVYFDNVGGPTLDAALANLRTDARVVLCGRISQTVAAEPYGVRNLGRLGGRRITMRNFLVFDYHDRYAEARTWLSAQIRDGRLQQKLHIVNGLENAPTALGMLFRGENTGKLVIKAAG